MAPLTRLTASPAILPLLILLSFPTFIPAASAKPTASPPPNIVLIISDDHAWSDYGFMGHSSIKTPHLDRLAAQSLVFPRGYVPASLCCPSLASIITGLYPHQHKITSNDPPNPEKLPGQKFYRSNAYQQGRARMNQHLADVPTLPRLLGSRGYLSLQTGKWWQGDFREGGFTHGLTRGQRHGDEGLEIGRKTMQPIRDFLTVASEQQKPFLIWYAPMMPHTPHDPPERILSLYLNSAPTPSIAKYWAMVQWFDETIGELRQCLAESGAADNTLILYVADNGWIQDPNRPQFAPKSKQSPYDGGLRTPILVNWPGRVKARKSNALVTSLDLFPTILNATGIPLPANLDGIDLLNARALKARRQIYGECFTHNAIDLDHPAANLRWRWIVQGDWKLIVPASQNEPGAPLELYHLGKDPWEETNLASRETRRLQKMRQLLDGWWPGNP